jgi:hypothetical protein
VDWQKQPLGIAVVHRSPDGALALEHVSVNEDGGSLSGAWLLDRPERAQLLSLLSHWVVVGTEGGLIQASKVLSEPLPSANLISLIAACQKSEEVIHKAWREYKDEDLQKRSKLVPLRSPKWPDTSRAHDPASMLQQVGMSAFPETTPPEMRGVLAESRLAKYTVDSWQEIEADRLSRPYLANLWAERQLLPTDWLAANPCFWSQSPTTH